MSKYGILATLLHYRANTVLLKSLPRWRADTIRPYMDVPHRNRCVICGWLKLTNYSIDCVHCQSVWFMEHFIT